MRQITLIVAVLALALAAPAIADKGGHGNGGGGNGGSGGGGGRNVSAPTGSCTASGNTVSATGLPNGEVINFMITDASGSWGWVLGYTDDGSWSVAVPTQKGSTTYEFVSKTWGPNGTKYTVFATCSA
jgi:hypothetical protein